MNEYLKLMQERGVNYDCYNIYMFVTDLFETERKKTVTI